MLEGIIKGGNETMKGGIRRCRRNRKKEGSKEGKKQGDKYGRKD